MKAVLTNYNHTPDWVREFTEDYLIYDRSDSREYLRDFPQEKIVYESNVGDADYSKLNYLVDNYYELPEVFLWSKSNLFKFITPEEWEVVKNNTEFTPLLTKGHKTYEPVCRYADTQYGPIYEEINNSWYLSSVPAFHFNNYTEFSRAFHLPNPPYLRFAPGGSYILTRERVHRYGQAFYDELRSILPYCQRPGEAHMLERTYFNLWG